MMIVIYNGKSYFSAALNCWRFMRRPLLIANDNDFRLMPPTLEARFITAAKEMLTYLNSLD